MTEPANASDKGARAVGKPLDFSHALSSSSPADAIDGAGFRTGMRALAGAVTVLTTADGRDRLGLTATAVCSLSADPPRLLACVNQRGPTFAMMKRTGHLVVNALAEGHAGIAECFAGLDRSVSDRFQMGEWTTGRYREAPVLQGAVCSFECAISEILNAVSHGLIIADIKAVHVTSNVKPLLYADGAFVKLASDFVDPRHAFQF